MPRANDARNRQTSPTALDRGTAADTAHRNDAARARLGMRGAGRRCADCLDDRAPSSVAALSRSPTASFEVTLQRPTVSSKETPGSARVSVEFVDPPDRPILVEAVDLGKARS